MDTGATYHTSIDPSVYKAQKSTATTEGNSWRWVTGQGIVKLTNSWPSGKSKEDEWCASCAESVVQSECIEGCKSTEFNDQIFGHFLE